MSERWFPSRERAEGERRRSFCDAREELQAAEHALQLVASFCIVEELDARVSRVALDFLDAEVSLGDARDLRQVRDRHDLGALGFIPKSGQREVMLRALELIFAGGQYIPPEILMRDSPATPPAAKPPVGERPRPSPADLGLTGRQLDVLRLMLQGKSNKAICRVLDLAEPTVKNHVTAILKALKVTNRTEAVIRVRELGWEFPPIKKNP